MPTAFHVRPCRRLSPGRPPAAPPARRLATRYALLAALAAAPLAAAATDEPHGVVEMSSLSLDALLDLEVTGPSRAAERMSDAAASVTVITADEIRALGYRTLADALRSVRGVSVSNDHNYSYLDVRGFYAPGDYNTRVLLLVNGNRVNDNLYDQAYVGLEAPVDIERVERIEFVPGQGSAVYGANAFFGVINVVTRDIAHQPSSVGVRVASGERRGARATLSGTFDGGARWLVAASRTVSKGFDRFDPAYVQPGVSDGWTRGTDGEQRTAANFALSAGPWRAELLHSDRTKGVSAPVVTIFGDPRTNNRDALTLLDVAHRAAPGPGLELSSRVFAGYYHYVADWAMDYPPPTVNRDNDRGRWWGLESRLAGSHGVHRWQVGAEFQRSDRIEFVNVDLDAADEPYLDSESTDDRIGVYAEDRITLGEQWGLTVGSRVDHQRGESAQLHPRLALSHRPAPPWVLKLIYGSAFRPPNAFERDYEVAGPGGYVRNPGLRPERVRGTEAVAEWTPAARLRFTASAYRTRAEHMIVLETAGDDGDMYQFRNLGSVSLTGLELEAQWQSQRGIRLRTNYSHQRSDGAAVDLFGLASPRQMAKLAAVLPAAGGHAGVELLATSRRGAAPGHGLLNLTWSQRLPWGGADLVVGVRNAFDRDHADPGALPETQPIVRQDGRTWHLALDLPL